MGSTRSAANFDPRHYRPLAALLFKPGQRLSALPVFFPDPDTLRSGAMPAERRILRIPAQKPRRRKTINPQGEVPAKRSITHPIPAPKRIPAMNSLESLSAAA
jgi:hypothetical protein